MPIHIDIGADFDIGARECLSLMSEPELHKELSEFRGVAHRQAKNMKIENGIRSWQLEIELLEQAPRFARQLIGKSRLKWVQTFFLDMSTLEFDIQVSHPLSSRTLEVSGKGRIRAMNDDTSRFEIEVDIVSRLPLVGRKFEKLLAERFKRMMEVDLSIRRDYIAQRRSQDCAKGMPRA